MMNNSYRSIAQLWSMQPHTFNEWRAKNDLPILFDFLKELLPSFDRWLETLPFEMDVVLRITPTGDLFKGNKKKIVIKRAGNFPGAIIFECREGTSEEAVQWWADRSREIEVLGEIEPYFKWAKINLGRKRFFIWDKINRQVSDKFIRGSCSGLNVDSCVTQAHLFSGFKLFKLGQIKLEKFAVIGGKNLDFCDLDFLTITGDMHGYGSDWKTISYSSFRELRFHYSRVCFYNFYECWIDDFSIENSKIQDFYFEKTDVSDFRISDSFVLKLELKNSRITPFIQNTELREVKFEPKKNVSPSEIARTYRLLRAAYQSSGLRQEASECYYQERAFERKSYFHPYTIDREKFRGVLNGGRLSAVFETYRKGYCQTYDLPREISRALISKIKMHTFPKYLIPLMRYRLKWLVSAFESILWGYGERPSRILFVALTVIAAYAGLYSMADWLDDKGGTYKLGFFDSLYFSIVTFTTLGYGDITPKTQVLKMLAGSEALLGAFTIGLIVAGFSNRSRY